MSIIGLCGVVCSDCSMFGKECSGCAEEMKSSGYRCKVYECVTEKGFTSCVDCIEEREECVKVDDHLDLCPLYVLKGMTFIIQ